MEFCKDYHGLQRMNSTTDQHDPDFYFNTTIMLWNGSKIIEWIVMKSGTHIQGPFRINS